MLRASDAFPQLLGGERARSALYRSEVLASAFRLWPGGGLIAGSARRCERSFVAHRDIALGLLPAHRLKSSCCPTQQIIPNRHARFQARPSVLPQRSGHFLPNRLNVPAMPQLILPLPTHTASPKKFSSLVCHFLGRDPAVASFFAAYLAVSATYPISSRFALAEALP